MIKPCCMELLRRISLPLSVRQFGCGTRNWTWLIGLWARLVALIYRIALRRALRTLVEPQNVWGVIGNRT